MKCRFSIGIIALFLCVSGHAQEKQDWAKEHINFSGYIKYLNISSFRNLKAISNDNLFHNRLKLKVYFDERFTFSVELRNRAFWGSSVQTTPDYASIINDDGSAVNMNINVIDQPAFLLHVKVDRLYLDYRTDTWQITVGRQRINWGKNLVWNPNDIFNAYNFFNFDYEERPGADAVHVQYFTSESSSLEAAISYAKKWERSTAALNYKFNAWEYDFQFIAAKYLKDYMLGFGWEGAIKDVGIKGEFSYFLPQKKSDNDREVFVGTVSLDYYFKNGISLTFSTLYNGNQVNITDSFNSAQFSTIRLNAKQLMPNRWSSFVQASKSLTPAMTTSLALIYAYDFAGVFMMPQFVYNIAQNWDFDVTAQIFFANEQGVFSNVVNGVYLRFRYSF